MKQKKYLAFLIPLIAVVVVVESVVLVSGLNKKSGNDKVVNEPTKRPAVLDIVFGGKTQMKLGESGEVEVSVVSKNDYAVDSIDLFAKYDKTAFDLSELVPGNTLPKPNFSKISDKTSLVVMSYKITESEGFKIRKNEPVSLMKFRVTPKKEGSYIFEINTGGVGGESETMFVKTGTPITTLPYSSNKLSVRVER